MFKHCDDYFTQTAPLNYKTIFSSGVNLSYVLNFDEIE